MIEEKLIGLMLGNSGVAAIAGARVTPSPAPQDQPLPYVTAQVISSEDDHHSKGPGLDIFRYQIDAFARTYAEAKALSRAIIALFNGYSGTSDGVEIMFIALKNKQDLFDNAAECHRVSTDFRITAR